MEQCGLELQAPHLRTTTKRRIETSDVDIATLPDDSLRFVGWAPEALEALFSDLDPDASLELEAVYLCERDVDRVQSMTSGGFELHPPTELAKGTVTVVRVVVPREAFADGRLEVRVRRIVGPDVVVSELRLFSSRPPSPVLTVVGDSRGGLIGTVAAPDYRPIPDARVRVKGAAGTYEVSTDPAGVFRVPLRGDLVRCRDQLVSPAGGKLPGHHADRVHAARRPRRHELVCAHVAARHLARHLPVQVSVAPPRTARHRRGLGSGAGHGDAPPRRGHDQPRLGRSNLSTRCDRERWRGSRGSPSE